MGHRSFGKCSLIFQMSFVVLFVYDEKHNGSYTKPLRGNDTRRLNINQKKERTLYLPTTKVYSATSVYLFLRNFVRQFRNECKTEKMKITLSGSLGHIGRPLTQELVQKNHSVTVISSNPERQKDIIDLGATAAIGSLEDADFITSAFEGADAVFCMVPPANYFDPHLDLLGYYEALGHNYANAIAQNGVKKVVNLSTIGGNLEKGNGILLGAHHVENILNALSSDVAITHIRPTEFYYNLFPQAQSAKANGFISSNIDADVTNSWVSPEDIASVVAEEITTPPSGRNVRYVASDEVTYRELVAILGKAIGNPDLKWVTITDEQMREGLEAAGMQPAVAAGMTEMYASINSGLLYEHYNLHKPAVIGQVKMNDFAEDFANAYRRL